MPKSKQQQHEPYGQLGKIFMFSRDDLAANRAGYMTRFQIFGFNFIERKLFGWMLNLPPIRWVKPRKVIKATGKIKSKQYSTRVVNSSGGGEGGGHQVFVEKRQIQFMNGEDGLGFYVTEKQYNSLPQNIEMTLYYEPDENRIVSVEPPYEKE